MARESRQHYQLFGAEFNAGQILALNQFFASIAMRLDAMEGLMGDITLYGGISFSPKNTQFGKNGFQVYDDNGEIIHQAGEV